MCTAVTYKTECFYFGRTLDYEHSFNEEIVITPKNFPLSFKFSNTSSRRYAIIGSALVEDGYPLYFDAANEKGLCMAGLNFVGNAFYGERQEGKENVAQYEFIPFVLSRCASLKEARSLLCKINITNTPFNSRLGVAQLHWIIADGGDCITVEATERGLEIFENRVGVLTNNPAFAQQEFALNNYMHLSPSQPKNTFAKGVRLEHYSRGMGGIGLPGDLSSSSRFIRAAFVKGNSVSEKGEEQSVGQFFHILDSVAQPRGCCEVEGGKYETTVYSSCINADKGIYYYVTYNNRQINAVDINKENLEGVALVRYPFEREQKINRQN